MESLIQQIVAGMASGGIYASVALALVMIYQSTEHLNFAQGSMAMFSTYICWSLLQVGIPYWGAFIATMAFSFIGGAFIQLVILRPVAKAPVLSVVIVFIGLLVIFESMAGWIFSYLIKSFPSPFPEQPLDLGGIPFGYHTLGAIGVTLMILVLLFVFFRYTTLGLAMRAAAHNPVSSRLVGIRVNTMLGLGWGLAAIVGAVAGMMVAPVVFLDPTMMDGILLYAFASALLGGITSPGGAVLGGFIVGIGENLLGAYVPFIGTELKQAVALVLIIAVLLVKPSGFFGKVVVHRV